MKHQYSLHLDTDLSNGLQKLLEKLESALGLTRPMNMYIAGGMAAHLYTGVRSTTDVDAEFGGKVFVPDDLTFELPNGEILYLDKNYNSTFALMHEDYLEDAVLVPLKLCHLVVHILSPVDLAVSKIARYADQDKADISSLAAAGLISSSEVASRAEDALVGFVGTVSTLKLNIDNAVKLIDDCEHKKINETKR